MKGPSCRPAGKRPRDAGNHHPEAARRGGKRAFFQFVCLVGNFFNRYFLKKKHFRATVCHHLWGNQPEPPERNRNQTTEAGAEAIPAASGHQSHLGTGTRLRRPRGCGSAKLWGGRGGLGRRGGFVDRGPPPNHDVSRPGRGAGGLV